MNTTKPTNQGNCIDCGAVIQQPVGSGRRKLRCEPCAKARNRLCASRRAERLSIEGRCVICGKNNADGKLRCSTCASLHAKCQAKRRARRKTEGRCKCGGIPQGEHICCPKCLMYLRQYREKNKAATVAFSGTVNSL